MIPATPLFFLDILCLKWEVGIEMHQLLWLAAPQSVGREDMTAQHYLRRKQVQCGEG